MVTNNSPNGVSVHVGAHALRTTSAIFFFFRGGGSFLCILGSFLKVKVTEWGIFLGCAISNTFLGA